MVCIDLGSYHKALAPALRHVRRQLPPSLQMTKLARSPMLPLKITFINHRIAGIKHHLRVMILLRLSPLIPFNALDYISGETSISFRDYALALFAMLPGTVMFCMVGATASSLTDTDSSPENKLAHQISLIGGLLFAVVGVSVASYYSKMELDKVSGAILLCCYCVLFRTTADSFLLLLNRF